jgi:hypothetical protein
MGCVALMPEYSFTLDHRQSSTRPTSPAFAGGADIVFYVGGG